MLAPGARDRVAESARVAERAYLCVKTIDRADEQGAIAPVARLGERAEYRLAVRVARGDEPRVAFNVVGQPKERLLRGRDVVRRYRARNCEQLGNRVELVGVLWLEQEISVSLDALFADIRGVFKGDKRMFEVCKDCQQRRTLSVARRGCAH